MIKMKLDSKEVTDYMGKIYRQSGDLRPFFTTVVPVIHGSVVANFRKGGRPKKWAAHSPWTRKVRAKTLGKHGLGQDILQASGKMYRSLGNVKRIRRDTLHWGIGGVVYAAMQHYGGTIRPKSGKYLTLPFPGVTGRARDYKDTFFRGKVMFQSRGKGKPKPLFLLMRSVTIPARPFMMFQTRDIDNITNYAAAYFLDPEGAKRVAARLPKGGYGT